MRSSENALAARGRWTDDRGWTGYGLIGATALGLSAYWMAVGGLGMAAGIVAVRRRRLSAEGSRILARDDRAARLAAEAVPAR